MPLIGPLPHFDLGDTLVALGRPAEANVHYRRALELNPNDAQFVAEVGSAYLKAGRRADAEALCRRALDLKPATADANYALSYLLCSLGAGSEAVEVCRRLVELRPNFAEAHVNLGNALMRQGQNADADAEFRKAIELKPGLPQPHINLGNLLLRAGKFREAEAAYRRAIALDPRDFMARHNLGLLLFDDMDRPTEAEPLFRKVVELKPDLARGHFDLGCVLFELGRSAEAEGHWRRATELYAKLPERDRTPEDSERQARTHCNLGKVLQKRGQLQEAVAEFRLCHELGSKLSGWSEPSAQWLRDAERMADLASRLPALLAERFQPADADEGLLMAKVCNRMKHHTAAAKYYAAAFAAKPKLADELNTHRYSAACDAALAGTGRGEDAGNLDDTERSRLRWQALDWLRAEYAAVAKLGDAPPDRAKQRRAVHDWQSDPDFAGVRDITALAKLPDAEAIAWLKFWADVDELLKRSEEPQAAKTPDGKP
jgi:Flp pilus assembly protein TadD